MNILLVFAGGGIGALLRYGVQLFMGKPDGHSFPFATFVVNVLGCLLIGVLAAMLLRYKWNEQTLLFVFTGLLGGFTTFSSFSLEFVQLLKNKHELLACTYAGLSNLAGLSLCAGAYYILK